MTLAIPEELHKKMKMHGDIKWTEVMRNAIEQRIEDLEVMNRIASKSKLTMNDVEQIGKKIKAGIAKRHGLSGR